VSVLRVRGRALPDGEPVDLYADGDQWTTDPVPAAELVAEGWLLPGLVDAHTHCGLGRQDRRQQELQGRAELQLEVRVRVDSRQLTVDPACSADQRGP
jgi:imidazolonepropionase-like amidohydrolase